MKKAVIILALLLAISAALNIIYIRARVSGGADGQTRPDTVRLVDTLRYVSPAPVRDTIIRYVRVRLPSTPPAQDNPGSPVNPGNSAESAEKAAADTDTAGDNGEEGFLTLTLAKIYIRQQRYEKALEIMRKVNLNNPKKSAYFADQIRFLQKLIVNKNHQKP